MLREFDALARKILAHLAQTLSLSSSTFDPLLETITPWKPGPHPPASALEAIRYFIDDGPTPGSSQNNATASCEAHVDKGLLTLIHADTKQGLEVNLSVYRYCKQACMHNDRSKS